MITAILAVGAMAVAMTAAMPIADLGDAAVEPQAPPGVSLPPRAREPEGPIETVLLGSIMTWPFACTEHPSGQLSRVGDALGTDCFPMRFSRELGFMTLFEQDGLENEDWHGWGEPVFAPVDGQVVSIMENEVVNTPGQSGRPPASQITLSANDDVRVVIGHIVDLEVGLGDRVERGQVIGRIGNNGMSRAPHIHIGAYRNLEPLQVRWDLRSMITEHRIEERE